MRLLFVGVAAAATVFGAPAQRPADLVGDGPATGDDDEAQPRQQQLDLQQAQQDQQHRLPTEQQANQSVPGS